MSLLEPTQGEMASVFNPPGRGSSGRAQLRYQRVIELIDKIIASRGLESGSLLPTQKELAEMANVSLITVRRALDELEREGRVIGHQGVGTFVARPRIVSQPANRGGLLATLAERGITPDVQTHLLEVRLAMPKPTIARALGLASGDPVWQVVRLRLIDGQPMVIEQALVPEALAPDLGKWRDDLQESLYGHLARHHGLADDHEEQYLEVHSAGARERRLLGLPSKAHVVRLRGVSFTATGIAFDCFEQVYPADEFAFYVSGQTARRLLRPADLRGWGVAASGKESA